MKNDKPVMITLAEAARRLAAEHPEFPYTKEQLRRMCYRRQIPHMNITACGTQRKNFSQINYNLLVEHLKKCFRAPIAVND